MTREPLEIRPVRHRRDRHDFYRVRLHTYRHDPAAVLPLKSLDWLPVDPQRHPFYEHARREVWIAYRQGKPVGRIAAIVDDLYNEHYGNDPELNQMGFVGSFEAPDDRHVASALFDQAFQWLRDQGCRRVRGPVNPSMKGEFGVLLTGHEYPPFLMMAHSPPYYDGLFQSVGFLPRKKFFSFLYEHATGGAEFQENHRKLAESCRRLQTRFPELTIRAATRQTLEPMLREINRIGNTIRAQGWGFVPMTSAELEFMVKQVKRIIRPETVIGCYMHDRLVGYNVTIPNMNWALRRAWGTWDWLRLPQLLYWKRQIPEGRLIAVGVDPNIRAKGMAALLTQAMVEQGLQFERWEFGWIAEDNLLSMAALSRAVPMHKYKTYQMYERDL